MFDSGGMESFTSGGPSGKKRKRDQDRLNLEQREQRARRMQIREHLRQETIFQKCHFCYGASRGSKVFKKHLVISLGDKCLLMLPPFGSLVDQHCIIAPLDHKLSMAHLDEDEQHEVERFKQSLRNMFMAQNMDVLFMETVTPYNLRRQRHAYLECIPVPIHAGQEAPSFFKVAIMESDEEWSQHKKVIDTQGRSIQKVSLEYGLCTFLKKKLDMMTFQVLTSTTATLSVPVSLHPVCAQRLPLLPCRLWSQAHWIRACD